jgi:hypothetical protein
MKITREYNRLPNMRIYLSKNYLSYCYHNLRMENVLGIMRFRTDD